MQDLIGKSFVMRTLDTGEVEARGRVIASADYAVPEGGALLVAVDWPEDARGEILIPLAEACAGSGVRRRMTFAALEQPVCSTALIPRGEDVFDVPGDEEFDVTDDPGAVGDYLASRLLQAGARGTLPLRELIAASIAEQNEKASPRSRWATNALSINFVRVKPSGGEGHGCIFFGTSHPAWKILRDYRRAERVGSIRFGKETSKAVVLPLDFVMPDDDGDDFTLA